MLRRDLAMLAAALLLAACDDDPPPEAEWQIVHEALPGALISVWGTSATDVWTVGGDPGDGTGPFVLHFDGEGWTRLATGTEGALWWVHGFEGGPVLVGGEGGHILRYAGGAFEAMETPGTATVFGIWGSSPDDVWAVGGTMAAGGGFVWRFDGSAWTEVAIPAEAEMQNIYKVWGTAADDVWLVGTGGLLMHWDGSEMAVLPSGTTRTIFTVHALGDRVAAVGGLGTGVILEPDPATGEWQDVTPELIQQMIGIWLTESGGFAVGVYGEILRRDEDGWVKEDSGFALAESLHGVWVDPDGGVWAVGGNVLAYPLVQGILMHRGTSEVPGGSYDE